MPLPRSCRATPIRGTRGPPTRSLPSRKDPSAPAARSPRYRSTGRCLAMRPRASAGAWASSRDCPQRVGHLHRDARRLGALHRGARARLLFGVGGEHAVGDRDSGLQLHVEDAARAFVGDYLEVIGFAAHHRTQRHAGSVAARREAAPLERERLERQRDLERSGDAHHVDVARGHPQLHELLVARGEKLAHDLFVEAAPGDADVHALAAGGGDGGAPHTAAFTALASSGDTYSTTSRPKPDMLGMRLGRASTRILPTFKSFRICAPMPCRRGSHLRLAARREGDSSRRSRISAAGSGRRGSTITPSFWCATMRIASCTEKAWRAESKSKRSRGTKGSGTRTRAGGPREGPPLPSP